MPDVSKLLPSEGKHQTFLKAGSRYVSSTGTLTLHHRHEYTALKPRQYLMFYPAGDGSPTYLTGLYPQPDGGFIGEKKGIYYRITLTDQAITLLRIGGEGEKVL